jgi:hypothetical protein
MDRRDNLPVVFDGAGCRARARLSRRCSLHQETCRDRHHCDSSCTHQQSLEQESTSSSLPSNGPWPFGYGSGITQFLALSGHPRPPRGHVQLQRVRAIVAVAFKPRLLPSLEVPSRTCPHGLAPSGLRAGQAPDLIFCMKWHEAFRVSVRLSSRKPSRHGARPSIRPGREDRVSCTTHI